MSGQESQSGWQEGLRSSESYIRGRRSGIEQSQAKITRLESDLSECLTTLEAVMESFKKGDSRCFNGSIVNQIETTLKNCKP